MISGFGGFHFNEFGVLRVDAFRTKKTLMELSANKSTEVLLGGVSTLASSLNFCLKKKLGIEGTELLAYFVKLSSS